MAFPFRFRLSAWFPVGRATALLREKKKGCRRRKCSKWKGGCCRCGRD
jgi:hypothetical protein